MSITNKLDFILELMNKLKTKEIMTYKIHDDEENSKEFVGFDVSENEFYVKTISEEAEEKAVITFKDLLWRLEPIFKEQGL